MISDSHVHTYFSGDSQADIDKVIEQAISKGMQQIAITDHHDFLIENDRFVLDFNKYNEVMPKIKDKYKDKITVLYGIELGLDKRFVNELNEITTKYDFDFIIGSSHIANGIDPYFKEYWENRSIHNGMMEYFESIYENLTLFDNFNIYGHIDYAIRYTPDGTGTYEYKEYSDILDKILTTIISKGKGIEINTSNLRKGLTYTNPTAEVIKKYKELGGEIITIGSDSHQDDENGVGFGFDVARNILSEAGFKHYNTFEKRVAKYHDL
ncbi:MAG: histidinol-phosphatase HisJ family protein [Lachnospiraceae bacterium]|nr:histidinol-phosphatase HisJ family protein [Lachnospiraceae bacterium]